MLTGMRFLLRWGGRLALVLYFFAASVILIGRHWLAPEIDRFRPVLEAQLSAALGLKVDIAAVEASWPGLFAHLSLSGVRLYDADGNPVLSLPRIEADVAWSSLWRLEPRLHRLAIEAPALDIRRDRDGVIYIAGLPLARGGDGRFADWLLAQHQILIRDARLTWHDEARAAPPLTFERLDFALRNRGRQHSFGLTARPDAPLAQHLDVRANLKGRSLRELLDWQGTAYLDLAGIDLAAWAPWLDLPFELKQGRGDLRLWLDFAGDEVRALTADLGLADLSLRLAPSLEALALTQLGGRFVLRREATATRLQWQDFSLASADGLVLAPTQASLRLETGRQPGGEFKAEQLDLTTLAALAPRLPLPASLHEALARHAPQGRLSGFQLAWQGPVADPQRWRIAGAFSDLALAAHERLPGFAGLSGRIEGSESAGTLLLDSHELRLMMPAVFPEPTLSFAQLKAEIGWRDKAGATEFLFQRFVFHNADARGELTGSLRHAPQGDEIDLAARLTEAVGSAVWRYLPFVVNPDARDWLRRALVGGRAENVSLRLKGRLADFPYREGKSGIFQVKGLVRGVTLDFAPGWPRMSGIEGDLLFEGARMTLRARRAEIMGVALADIEAVIPDLEAKEGERLLVKGLARGETQQFLDFIAASPVAARIDRFTETMRAQGKGELRLALDMPLRRVAETAIEGRYRFFDNRIEVLPTLPPLVAAQGELAFTQDKLQAKGLRARFLDQPLTLEVTTQAGGVVRIGMNGRLEAGALRQFYSGRALDHLAGAAGWRGTLQIKKPSAELRLESDLRGLASSLPEPFNKSAADSLPLLVQARLGQERDEWQATLGSGAALRLLEGQSGWRGRLALGEAAVRAGGSLPAQGVAVVIQQPRVDLDTWLTVLDTGDKRGSASGPLRVSALDLKASQLRLAERTFHDVQWQATASGTRWQWQLQAREVQGQLAWDTSGAGRISGRLARLHLSPATPAEQVGPADETRDMPALDLTIDSFRIAEMQLGTLKLKAENRAGLWQARFEVNNDAAQLSGQGRWQPQRAAPETMLVFRLEIQNAEKLLDRLGMPDALRRGEGEIEGELRWRGGPLAFDVPSLAGRLQAEIRRGQFKKLEPGVGRLLGVLSLQALPRRITLDFRDVFSEGFAFDEISGEARISRGTMTTDTLRIRGPAAQVMITGSADLVAETQNLRVRVQPAIGESLAVGAMIANPVAGAVAWAAQKLLRDPLDQIFAYEYAITGGWSDPQVERIARAASDAKKE